MASGNPFRSSQAFHSSASRPVPQAHFINTGSSVPETRRGDSDYVYEDTATPPPKTKKSVRIASPTTTIPPYPAFDDEDATLNELMARRSSQGRPASPPPPVTPAGFTNDTVTAGEANARVLGKDAMAMANIFPSPRPYFDKPQAISSPSSIPANPFSRTLASLEPQEQERAEERTSSGRPNLGNNRASLDVESFKNLLLTGKATPRPSGQPSQAANVPHNASGAQFESSSSTDTSSISRHSLFEPTQEIHAESPRTSVDMADSDEDESMGLVSEVKKGKKKPPPAPKHRHGKLVAQRQPQVVPFDSFSASEPEPPPIRRTDSSDMNKPLPPTPIVSHQSPHINTQNSSLHSPQVQPRRSEPSTPSEGTSKAKKAPPPVPLARRQSQLKSANTTGNRSRSSSNLTVSSQHSVELLSSPTQNHSDATSAAKSPPPPPPSRHGARLANMSNSSANSSSTELPQRSSSVRTARSIPDATSPRRSIIESEGYTPPATTGVNRTSSMSSNRKVSGGSTGSHMPPPPPPPRRKRESLDQQRPHIPSSSPSESRRTSTEYRRTSTEYRRTSVASESSLRREYAPVDEEKSGNEYALYSPSEEREEHQFGLNSNNNDDAQVEHVEQGEKRSDSNNILDDMEKFQREIDELRTRFKQVE